MLRVRKIILGTDRRLTETITQLMFHQGASLPGKHPRLEGGGPTVRYMRFTDLDDVKAKRRDVEAAVRAWCQIKDG